MNAALLAKAVLDGEDPKAFMAATRPQRTQEVLKRFLDHVEMALETLDSGNAEKWPPPAGMTDEEAEAHNYSRWGFVWRELEQLRRTL